MKTMIIVLMLIVSALVSANAFSDSDRDLFQWELTEDLAESITNLNVERFAFHYHVKVLDKCFLDIHEVYTPRAGSVEFDSILRSTLIDFTKIYNYHSEFSYIRDDTATLMIIPNDVRSYPQMVWDDFERNYLGFTSSGRDAMARVEQLSYELNNLFSICRN
jgi:hypothetical protein